MIDTEQFEELWREIEGLRQEKTDLCEALEKTRLGVHREVNHCLELLAMGRREAAVELLQSLSRDTEAWE